MINISVPSLTEAERGYLLEAFDSGWVSSRGPFIARAEAMLSQVTESPYASVVSSGTTALHLALLAVGVRPGDEVVLPALSYIASLNAVLYCGAVPVLVDVNETDWCINAARVEQALTERTRAVMGVDLYGHPADYQSLARVCNGRGIFVVADAAESLGALVGGTPAMNGADVVTYSFFGNKVVTSGEGGAITTTLKGIDRRVRQLRNQGNDPERQYVHNMLGYNYRMTNLSAAVLTAQLERLSELVAARNLVVDRYRHLLLSEKGYINQIWADHVVPSPWMYTVRLAGRSRSQRDAVIAGMADAGIETRPAFPLLSEAAYARVRVCGQTMIATAVANEGISLPTHPGLDIAAVDKVVSVLKAVTDKLRPDGS